MSKIDIQRRPSAKATAFLDRQHQLLIDGEWVAPLSGGTIAVFDPATAAGDVDLAVAAARRGVQGGRWRRVSGQRDRRHGNDQTLDTTV